jgi:VIT1/CCC1 family predicted Fe2+/Mn2+ transporter
MRLPRAAHEELHTDTAAAKLNWLRAAVLGANDGIVSLAALVVGVAGATEAVGSILLTGVAGLLAGALSMAVGEYVSVSSQRDTELALLDKERHELEQFPEAELEELTGIFEKKGLSRATAEEVARELSAHDAFAVHVREELGIHPEELTNPWHAAIASALAFVAGAIIPLIAIVLPPASVRIPITFAAVFIALAITGVMSARMSGAKVGTVTLRVVLGGVLAMLVTFGIGKLFGASAA